MKDKQNVSSEKKPKRSCAKSLNSIHKKNIAQNKRNKVIY